MSSQKSYPHYEINVKDNSIYTFAIEEILPVHRPLWVLRTQEGPVGEPVWCGTATKLKKVFGEQTLNAANKLYASPQTFFLTQTMTKNGAFIVRALDSSATTAAAILEAVVKEAPVVQYVKDVDPASPTYGQRKKDLDTESPTYGEYLIQTMEGATETTEVVKVDAEGNPVLDEQGNQVIEVVETTPQVPVTENGLEITFRIRPAAASELDPDGPGLGGLTVAPGENGEIVYPILALKALNPGNYGNDLAFRFFYRQSENDAANVAFYKSVFNSFSAVRREYNSTTTNVITDIYGRNYNSFAADPDCTDPESAVQYGMDAVITSAFDTDDAAATSDFPYTVFTYEDNLKLIGDRIIALESEDSLAISEFGFESKDEMNGYMIDVLSGLNIKGVSYDHVHVKGRGLTLSAPNAAGNTSASYDVLANGEVVLDSQIDMFLSGGNDGELEGAGEVERDEFVDHFFYQFLKLYVNPKIVDKFRYPMTHLYDCGYSMTTKYAMIDFLDTRDDVGVELTTQVLFQSSWATGANRQLKLNDQAADLANGLVLRERALLMRESVLKGTDCMRCSIYTQSGMPIAATYSKPTPFTLWSAFQHAQYGNTDQMSAQEPRGLPYSYNEMFKSWNWTPHAELHKEKTWDAGLNYCQYADMTRIFYPALRTVYREATSVLTDQWVVDALIYTKHECRKAWARFSGRNTPQAILEDEIKNYLENKLAYLYNGKYEFSVTVYKTEEEQKIGYIEHVKLKLTFPATMRVMIFDIEVNREGYDSESEVA